jgi:hypothetical protein
MKMKQLLQFKVISGRNKPRRRKRRQRKKKQNKRDKRATIENKRKTKKSIQS